MRKVLMFLGAIPNSIRTAARKALKITTKILQVLESRQAILVTELIPGDTDDKIRLALIAALKAFQPALQAAENSAARKALVARIGAELTAAQDGKRERMGQYAIWFEQVYQEDKKNG